VFYSKDKSKLARLLRKVYAASGSVGSGFWNFMVLHGYTNRQIAGLADKRDGFTHCDTKLTQDKDTYSFRVDTETAWEPHMAVFYKILREKYNDEIKLVYMAEECGNQLYVNSDEDGRYFTEHYMVDCCHNGEFLKEYFDTYQEAVSWIRDEYCIDINRYDSMKAVELKVEEVSGFADGDFFNFHRFEPEYSYGDERGAA
jgi:hypothetical protein